MQFQSLPVVRPNTNEPLEVITYSQGSEPWLPSQGDIGPDCP